MFGVLVEVQHDVAGDERSRTNPGHGYPAHTVKYEVLKTFPTMHGLETWLLANEQRHAKEIVLAIYSLKALQMRTQISVEVLEA